MDYKDYTPFDVLGRISELRSLHNNMTIYRLAKETGIPQSTISTWYRKNYYPSIDKIEIICQVFGITLSEFFFQEGDDEDAITLEDLLFLKQWHRLSSYQRDLVEKVSAELILTQSDSE